MSFTEPVEVSIVCLMVRAKVFYTLDGSVPDMYSKHFLDPIEIKETTTIRAIAMRHGYIPSEVIEATYTFNKAGLVFTPDAGLYRKEEKITITSNPAGSQIYFTLNGSEPYNNPALLYTEPITLPSTDFHRVVVKARAYRQNYSPSDVITKIYEFKISRMVQIPEGRFQPQIASPPNYLITDFAIGNYPVTQSEWNKLMSSNANESPVFGNNQPYNPVVSVSWFDAVIYCNMLSIDEGFEPCYSFNGNTDPSGWGISPTTVDSVWINNIQLDITKDGYRLPTEMEWMYVANELRFSMGMYSYSGGNNINEVAWYGGNSDGKSQPVGLKKGNSLGIFDLSGNVWEWCGDWFSTELVGNQVNPTGSASGTYKIQRGGSFRHDQTKCLIELSGRGNAGPHVRDNAYGFRVVKRNSTSEINP